MRFRSSLTEKQLQEMVSACESDEKVSKVRKYVGDDNDCQLSVSDECESSSSETQSRKKEVFIQPPITSVGT